jgi:hypothetical protein
MKRETQAANKSELYPEYAFPSKISGAIYSGVPSYVLHKPLLSFPPAGEAKPKSHILILKFSSKRIFCGLRSL